MISSMKEKAKWMHCFCSTGSVMKQHYSSCCLFKRLFFFSFLQGITWYIARISWKISFDLMALPLYYLYFFFFLGTMAFYLPLWCYVVIWNVQWKFQMEKNSWKLILPKASMPTNLNILGMLSIRVSLWL